MKQSPTPENTTPQATYVRYELTPKNHTTAILLSFFFGFFAVDRFYLGHVGIGIVKLLVNLFTFGIGAWIWYIIDFVLITTKHVNRVHWTN